MKVENYLVKKLENGITLIIDKNDNINTFSLGFFVKTGSINEKENESGISHFIEHLMFKGTNKRSAKEISEYVDFHGGSINAYTSREVTCYYIKMISEKLNIAIDVLTDMFLNSTFEEENIEKERNVIIEEIKMYEDIPEEIVHDKNIEFALNGIYSNSISGTIESLKNINREKILNYLNRKYVTENLIIVASGNFDQDYLITEISDKLKNFRKKTIEEKLDLSYNYNSGVNLIKKDTNQIHLCFTTRGIEKNNKKRYAYSILLDILGGGMSSRLFQKIREERGLAYSVYCYSSKFENCGLLTVYVGTTKEKYTEVIELIKEEFLNIKNNGINEYELEKAKNKFISSLTFSLENTHSRMNRLALSYIEFSKIIDLEEIKKSILAVNLNDVKEIANILFDENFYSYTVVGNIE